MAALSFNLRHYTWLNQFMFIYSLWGENYCDTNSPQCDLKSEYIAGVLVGLTLSYLNFTQLKLCLATANHNFKLVKITQIFKFQTKYLQIEMFKDSIISFQMTID